MSALISLNLIHDNPWQTRETYDPDYIQALADDIADNGLLQTPVARRIRLADDIPAHYELAFGHCRFRAYSLLHEQNRIGPNMPLELLDLNDEQMADFAWAENEQRRDVTPIERMHAIQKQMDDFGWTQAEIARRRGLSEATISNILRLGQLPETIQKEVHAGQVSERQAMALVPLYQLPDKIRSGRGYYSEREILARLQTGASSDDIRRHVDQTVLNNAKALDGQFPLDFAFEGEGLVNSTCTGCVNLFQHKGKPHCANRACSREKSERYANRMLIQASEESAIAVKAREERNYQTFYSSYDGSNKMLPDILAQGCEHLRLYIDTNPAEGELLDGDKYPNIVAACCNPDRRCTCAQAIRGQREESSEEQTARAQEAAQYAEEQARKDRLISAFRLHILEPSRQALLELIQANDVRFWQLLLDQMTQTPWEEISTWDLATCQRQLVTNMFRERPWEITGFTGNTLQKVNVHRARLGLESLELPDSAYADNSPTAKLSRRLERIESWMDRTADGMEEITATAVRGNLTNLEKIQQEYTSLSEADQTLPGVFERLEAHIAALSQWLDEYEAESDDEEELEAGELEPELA